VLIAGQPWRLKTVAAKPLNPILAASAMSDPNIIEPMVLNPWLCWRIPQVYYLVKWPFRG